MQNWYAIYTKPRWEKKVAQLLDEAEFLNYCPVMKVTRQWSDRKKTVEEPVFKGYVFIHCTLHKLWESLKTPGVLTVVRYLGKPAIIHDEEIVRVKRFLNEFEDVKVENISLEENAPVKIRSGVLMDYKGIVLEVWGHRALVKIDSLGIQLSAYFDKKNLEKI